jgi:hypothetical protein
MSEQPTKELPVVAEPRSRHWWQQQASSWPGLVAFMLAFAVGVSIIMLSVAAAVAESRKDTTISTQAAALLSTVLGGALGAVATYIGLSYAERRAGAPKPPEPPEAP